MISKSGNFFKKKRNYILNQIRNCKWYLDRPDLDYDQYEEFEEDVIDYKERLKRVDLEERDYWKNDLVQPGDSRFQTLYRNEWLKTEKEKELKKLKAKRIKAEREQFYKKNLHEGKSQVIKALDSEDKIRHG